MKHFGIPPIRGQEEWHYPLMTWGISPGYSLDPFVAIIQHSCMGNVSLTYEGNELRIRALRPIARNEEILTPWVEFSDNLSVRTQKLAVSWNITCSCQACLSPPAGSMSMRLRRLKATCQELAHIEVGECLSKLPQIERAIQKIQNYGLDAGSHIMRHLYHRAICAYMHRNDANITTEILKIYLRIYYRVEPSCNPPTRRLERLASLHNLRSMVDFRTPTDIAVGDAPTYPEHIRVLVTNMYPYWVYKMAQETKMAFGADSAASRAESTWMAEVLRHFNHTDDYDRHLVNPRLRRKFADLSRDAVARGLFVSDMNQLLQWAGIPAQTYQEMMR